MKKSKLMLIIVSVMLVALMILMPTQVKAETNEKLAVVNTSSGENSSYLIYIDALLSNADGFEFALSNDSAIAQENLIYENSATDNAGNAVAYYDSTNQKFGEVDITKPVYLWVRGNNDIQGLEVNLSESITSAELTDVENITKKIPVETEWQNEYSEKQGELTVTTILGTVKIKENENEKVEYSYKMVRLPAEDENYNKLWELKDKINSENSIMSVNEKIKLSTEFVNLYNELIKSADWTDVKDLTIEQPEDAVDGTQYVLLLKKEVKDAEPVYDVQFLTSAQDPFENYENVVNEEKVVVKRTTKLPITYDSIALWVVLAVIIIALIIVRRKVKKESKH